MWKNRDLLLFKLRIKRAFKELISDEHFRKGQLHRRRNEIISEVMTLPYDQRLSFLMSISSSVRMRTTADIRKLMEEKNTAIAELDSESSAYADWLDKIEQDE